MRYFSQHIVASAFALLGCLSMPITSLAQPAVTDDVSQITVQQLSPSAQSSLSTDSVINAELRFNIGAKDWVPGKVFSIACLFDTQEEGVTFDGSFPTNRYPMFSFKSGAVDYQFPLKYVFTERKLKRPITVHFFLMRLEGDNSTVVIAETTPVTFQ